MRKNFALLRVLVVNTKHIERVLALIAAEIALIVYGLTAAHTVTWLHYGADSGDLVAAAYTLGIPHPPGYPLYTMLAALFARLPVIEPAFGVALFSALAAAGAVFLLARAGSHLTPQPPSLEGKGELSLSYQTRGAVFVPPLAALGFAFAPLVWSQAVIPEVYALNLFFVALILWACLATETRRVKIAALAFGLGAAHHLSILLLAPGALVLLQPRRQDARAIWWFVLPLLLYAYLPLVSLGNPPVKWGDPLTPERFFWLVSAAQYRPYLFALSDAEVLSRMAFSARALLDQFTIVGLAFMLWGAIQLAMTRGRIFVGLLLMFAPMVLYALGYASRDSFLYLLPAFAIALLWLVHGVTAVLRMFSKNVVAQFAIVVLVALLPLFNVITNYAAMDVSHDRTAFEYARANLEPLSDDAVLFADGDEALFALWYYRHAFTDHNPRAVIVSQGLLQYDWYYDSLRRLMREVQFKSPQEVLDVPSRVREIIGVTFAEGRAVCFTDASPLHPQFEYETRGAVKCVVGERQ